MLTLLVLVFFAVFTVSALLLTASRSGASKQTEQTMTVLQAALATGNRWHRRSNCRYPQRRTVQRLPLAQSLAACSSNWRRACALFFTRPI